MAIFSKSERRFIKKGRSASSPQRRKDIVRKIADPFTAEDVALLFQILDMPNLFPQIHTEKNMRALESVKKRYMRLLRNFFPLIEHATPQRYYNSIEAPLFKKELFRGQKAVVTIGTGNDQKRIFGHYLNALIITGGIGLRSQEKVEDVLKKLKEVTYIQDYELKKALDYLRATGYLHDSLNLTEKGKAAYFFLREQPIVKERRDRTNKKYFFKSSK